MVANTVTSALRRYKQKDCEFKPSLGYTENQLKASLN
jgi:hypothetical protein